MAKGKYQQWITEEGQTLLRGWRRSGLTDEQICQKMGIGTTTLYRWKDTYGEIRDALKKGKEICDFEAEEALVSMFTGHYVEDSVTEINEVDGKQRKHIRKTKHWVEPNVTAIIFYLKCRAGWREQAQEDDSDVMERLAEMIASVDKAANDRLRAE